MLAALAPWLLWVAWVHHDSTQVQQQVSRHQQQDLTRLEAMLDDIHAATVDAMPLADAQCADVVGALRLRAAVTPQIRSLLLVRDGVIHCSTLSGEVASGSGSFASGQEALALVAGNAVAPDRPLLLYRSERGRHQVIAVVDALHVWRVASTAPAMSDTVWTVADMQMGDDGVLRPWAARKQGGAGMTVSSRYPMGLVTTSVAGTPSRARWPLRLSGLLALLAGVPVAYLVHRLARRRQEPRRELERAIRKGEFVPYYQPLVRAADMEWAGVEVLARWEHPTRGLLTPDGFLPRVERTALILPMTARLMARAADELANMLPLLSTGFHVAFNITPAHLAGRWLPEQCQRFLSSFPPGRVELVLELTEREGVEANAATLAVLDEVRRMGVRIALDDFGVGHSNLSHLQELRADRLKIDRGFVARLVAPGRMTPILRTILDLAERLDLDVVAEGVETWTQADALARHGVNLLQGYLFARPLAGRDLPAVLARPPISSARRGENVVESAQATDSKAKIRA